MSRAKIISGLNDLVSEAKEVSIKIKTQLDRAIPGIVEDIYGFHDKAKAHGGGIIYRYHEILFALSKYEFNNIMGSTFDRKKVPQLMADAFEVFYLELTAVVDEMKKLKGPKLIDLKPRNGPPFTAHYFFMKIQLDRK